MKNTFGKVVISGVDTSSLPVISENEKIELIRLAQSGDADAREKMIMTNLRLVLSVVGKFANVKEETDDLFQVGVIGLIKAIDHFDLSLNVRFATYGVALISGELRRHIRDTAGCSLHVPRSTKDLAYHALRAREELQSRVSHEPTADEIAAALGVNRSEITCALEAIMQPFSLYEPVYSETGETLSILDRISDSSTDSDWVEELSLREAIASLGGREKRILSLRFLSGRTQTQVAQEIGISQAQVSRLEKCAMDRIRSRI